MNVQFRSHTPLLIIRLGYLRKNLEMGLKEMGYKNLNCIWFRGKVL
jgi:hypothetical protein